MALLRPVKFRISGRILDASVVPLVDLLRTIRVGVTGSLLAGSGHRYLPGYAVRDDVDESVQARSLKFGAFGEVSRTFDGLKAGIIGGAGRLRDFRVGDNFPKRDGMYWEAGILITIPTSSRIARIKVAYENIRLHDPSKKDAFLIQGADGHGFGFSAVFSTF